MTMTNEQQIITITMIVFIYISTVSVCGIATGIFINPFVADTLTDNHVKADALFIYSLSKTQRVSGWVNITVFVSPCNCSEVTKMYLNGMFHSNGSRRSQVIEEDNGYKEVFVHHWNTSKVVDGYYLLSVYGKHDKRIESCVVIVRNEYS